MIVPSQAVKVVVATRPVDFRKGHDGLAALAQEQLGLDPHSGLIIVYRSKRGDRLKLLVWDGTGLVLVYKRLEDGKFAWPALSAIASNRLAAMGARRRDAAVARAVRGAVRRAGLAAGLRPPPGAPARCGGVTRPRRRGAPSR